MFADRAYDEEFFAAMADRGFYVFTSPPCHEAARPTESVLSRTPLNLCGQAAKSAPPPLGEAA